MLACGVAQAQDERFYAGVAALGSQIGVSLDKRVDSRDPDTLVPEPRRGGVLHDRSSGESVGYGPGLLAGYNHPLGDLYLGVEFEAAFVNEVVDGRFEGVGHSPGRNQLGESWPDRWTYDSESNYGVSVRLGRAGGVYALLGLRRVSGRLSTESIGCYSPIPCSAAADTPNFLPGTSSREIDLEGTTVAVGFERRVRERLALRIELRHTRYDDNRWVAIFDDVRVTVPTAVAADQTGLLVSLARAL